MLVLAPQRCEGADDDLDERTYLDVNGEHDHLSGAARLDDDDDHVPWRGGDLLERGPPVERRWDRDLCGDVSSDL